MKDKFFISQPVKARQQHSKPVVKPKNSVQQQQKRGRAQSSGESDQDESFFVQENKSQKEVVEDGSDSEAEETTQQKRIRLAKTYIEQLEAQQHVQGDDFNAAEIDRDLIAQRLRDDALEQQGRLITPMADKLTDLNILWRHKVLKPVTCVAISSQAVYFGTKGDKIFQLNFTGKLENTMQTDGAVYALALSSDGTFLASGGTNGRIQIWDLKSLKVVTTFNQHRDTVTGLVFKKTSTDLMLYSVSLDRSVKVFNMEARTYVETLFGHQDSVMGIDAIGSKQRCVTVGARDKSVRLWKIVEESQLVFRASSARQTKTLDDDLVQLESSIVQQLALDATGSLDAVACVDEDYWVTGSDSGTLAIWTHQRKKPVFTMPCANGLTVTSGDSSFQVCRETARSIISRIPQNQPYTTQPNWISAVAAVQYSDLIASGSCDGLLRFWRFNRSDRSLPMLIQLKSIQVSGWVTSLTFSQDGRRLLVGISREPRHGRWHTVPVQNSVLMIGL